MNNLFKLIEGKTTGGDPEATGRRVGKFLMNKFLTNKQITDKDITRDDKIHDRLVKRGMKTKMISNKRRSSYDKGQEKEEKQSQKYNLEKLKRKLGVN